MYKIDILVYLEDNKKRHTIDENCNDGLTIVADNTICGIVI